jgi:4-amino-4-deoxy-L-arabinose transferase-like glycosyltransferase
MRLRARLSVPRPLALIVAAAVIAGGAWAVFVPPFQTPDEEVHFAYVQTLAENGRLPDLHGRGLEATHAGISREQRKAYAAAFTFELARNPFAKTDWSRSGDEHWRDVARNVTKRVRSNGGGPNASANNPPIYYAYAALPYLATKSSDALSRMHTIRLASLLFLGLSVLFTWLLAGELTGRDRLLQSCAAVIVGLQPMITFISASITPDGMLITTWAATFWLGARILRAGASPPRAAALGFAGAIAVLVKATSYALLPAAGLALAIAAWRLRRGGGPWEPAVVAGLVAVLIPLIAWSIAATAMDRPTVTPIAQAAPAATVAPAATGEQLVATLGEPPPPAGERPRVHIRELASYIWQYYLPRLWFMNESVDYHQHWPLEHVLMREAWGEFNLKETQLPSWAYTVLEVFSLGFLAIFGLLILRRRTGMDPAVLAFFGLAVAGLLLALNIVEYRKIQLGQGLFIQGRYVLPLVPAAAACVAAAIGRLPARARLLGVAGVCGLMFALQALSLGIELGRFYA